VPPRVLLAVPGHLVRARRAHRRVLQLQQVSAALPACRPRPRRRPAALRCAALRFAACVVWNPPAAPRSAHSAHECPSCVPPHERPCCPPTRRFKAAKERGEVDEKEQQRTHARQSLERYMHYWQRWAENDSSRKQVRLKQRRRGGGGVRGRGWLALAGPVRDAGCAPARVLAAARGRAGGRGRATVRTTPGARASDERCLPRRDARPRPPARARCLPAALLDHGAHPFLPGAQAAGQV
jgi:hypothetical protein